MLLNERMLLTQHESNNVDPACGSTITSMIEYPLAFAACVSVKTATMSLRLQQHPHYCFTLFADPLVMLNSGDLKQVKYAVATLVSSAKVLNTLTLATSLLSCKGTTPVFSQELYAKVGCLVMAFAGLCAQLRFRYAAGLWFGL